METNVVANKIVLKDFYSESYVVYDMQNNVFMLDSKAKYEKFYGWFAEELCGIQNKKQNIFAIFCIDNRFYFIINQKKYLIHKQKFKVDIGGYIPFIDTITLFFEKEIYRCRRWSKDVDEFEMNDFFYFLKYTTKNNFNNFIFCNSVK